MGGQAHLQSVYIIGLGANLGERHATLRSAVTRICEVEGVEVCGCSPVYESPAFGPPQPNFLNAAIRLRTTLSPHGLLAALHKIEAALGRVRDVRWGPRTIDLDILWADGIHRCAQLTIPHPRLIERWWALRPLLDVAPELEQQYGPQLSALGSTPKPLCSL